MERAAALTPWLWHDTVPRAGWQQMAIDRALVARAAAHGACTFRLYAWERDSVSFGANEAATRTWDRERLERLQVPSVRRPTGGRGVWHDATDLTYAVTAPLAFFGDLRTAYRLIHEQLARAFRRVGAPAGLAPATGRPSLAPGACFDLAVGGEVVVAGRKTVGSAQALIGGAMLQHGAILRRDRASKLARFRLDSGPAGALICGSDLPAAPVMAEAIVAEWARGGATPAPGDVIEEAIHDSVAFADHFRDSAWTWRR